MTLCEAEGLVTDGNQDNAWLVQVLQSLKNLGYRKNYHLNQLTKIGMWINGADGGRKLLEERVTASTIRCIHMTNIIYSVLAMDMLFLIIAGNLCSYLLLL